MYRRPTVTVYICTVTVAHGNTVYICTVTVAHKKVSRRPENNQRHSNTICCLNSTKIEYQIKVYIWPKMKEYIKRGPH